jgi:hypothetical protein
MRFDDHRLNANRFVDHEMAFRDRQTDLSCMDDPQTRRRVIGLRARRDYWPARAAIHSFSAAFMRDCQPAPPARKCMMTSASSRNVVATLGDATRGRPRRTGAESKADRQGSSDMSGASSGSVQCWSVESLFAIIRFPHADDAAGAAARGPDQKNHTMIEAANCDEAFFSVVIPVVGNSQRFPFEHLTCARHIKAARGEGQSPLCRIEVDIHPISCYYNKSKNGSPSP